MSGIAVFYGGTREMAKSSLSLLGHRGSRTTVLETGQKIGMGAVVSRDRRPEEWIRLAVQLSKITLILTGKGNNEND